MLRKMCLGRRRLPPSYAITDELRWIGDYPYGGGGNADVWRGVYRGSGIAIKVLRVNSKNLARLERVRPLISVLLDRNAACADEWDRNFVTKWSCGSNLITRTCYNRWAQNSLRRAR